MSDSALTFGTSSAPRRRLRGAPRLIFWAFGLAALTFVCGFGVFASHISQLAAPDEPGEADAIIVLTGGQARIDNALGLLQAGKGRRLLISGVNPIADLDDLQRATGGDRKLFACCVDIDHAALDTVGNAEESAKWMAANAFDSAIVVTNNYHMPRSLMEMRRVNEGAVLTAYPVVNARLDRGEWLTRPDALRVLFTEYTKFLAAFARTSLESRPSAFASLPGVGEANAAQ